MAIFHLSAKAISRGKGQNVVHKAAYNARTILVDHSSNSKTKNYKNEGALLYEHIFVPPGAPEWMTNREQLWNHVEKIEVRKDARLGREIDVALPYELTDEQRIELLNEFVQKAFITQGMVADVVIHTATRKGDKRNVHAHILLATRGTNNEGFESKKNRDWNKVETLNEWRALWSDSCNSHLERYGHSVQISHASHKTLGIDRVPTKHVGPKISRMESKGIKTRRGDYLRANKSGPASLGDQ